MAEETENKKEVAVKGKEASLGFKEGIIPDRESEAKKEFKDLRRQIDDLKSCQAGSRRESRDLKSQITVLQNQCAKHVKKNNALIEAGQAQDRRIKSIQDSIRMYMVERCTSKALSWRHTGFMLILWYKAPTENDIGELMVDHESPGGKDWRRASGSQIPREDQNLREAILRFCVKATQDLAFAPIQVTAKPETPPLGDEDDDEEGEE
jgi:hypothetical protein